MNKQYLVCGLVKTFILFILVWITSYDAKSTTIIKEKFEDVVRKADLIIYGRVSSTQESVNFKSFGWKSANISINGVIKGVYQQSDIVVDACVTRDCEVMLLNSGLAQLDHGENAMMFLAKHKNSWVIVGAFQGKYSVVENVIKNTKVTLSEFIQQVRNILGGSPATMSLQIESSISGKRNTLAKAPPNYATSIVCGGDGVNYLWLWNVRWNMYNIPPTVYINTSGARDYQNNPIPFSRILPVIERAFGSWNSAEHSYLDCQVHQLETNDVVTSDSRSTITWDNLGSTGIGAIATNFTKDANGNTIAADIVFNSLIPWNADDINYPGNCPSPNDGKDIEDVAAHEIGHFWGLNHASNTELTLYYSSGRCETKRRTPESGDILGVNDLYHEVYGSISQNETWCSKTASMNLPGQIKLSSDAVIEQGVTVTVDEEAQIIFSPNKTITCKGEWILNHAFTTLNSGQRIIIEDGGTMRCNTGTVITLNGGIIECKGSTSKIIIADPRCIQGSGTIVNGNITWTNGLDVRESETLVFQSGGFLDFDCIANQPQYIINNGNMEFQGSTNSYTFGECLAEIRIYESGTFVTREGTTLQHLPILISWDESILRSNGTQQDPCFWLFRELAGLEDYASLIATRTTFGGSSLQVGAPKEWSGILVGDVNSLIDLDYCIVQDIYVDQVYSGSGVHFYQSGDSYNNRIKNSRIIRNNNGQDKNGDGVFLQPGSKFSHVRLECSEINQDWYTGFTSVGSHASILDSKIMRNLVGIGVSVNPSTLTMQRSCIEDHVFQGLVIDESTVDFASQNEAGGNRIVNNARDQNVYQQINIINNSLFYGGWLNPGTGLPEGYDNHISSTQQKKVANVDASSAANFDYNWLGVTPNIFDPLTGLCYLDAGQITGLFDFTAGSQLTSAPAHCNEILPSCSTECQEFFQGSGRSITFSKSSALSSHASSINELRAYARAGNFAEVYRFIGTLMPSNISAPLAKRLATMILHLENTHAREYPDSISVIRNRINIFLLSRIGTTNISETKSALLNVLARSLFVFEDIQGADYRISQLRTQYPNSPYAEDILPTLQLVAMAQRDSVKMDNVIRLMQQGNFSSEEMRIARTMKRAYHRFRPQSPYPKHIAYDTEVGSAFAELLNVKNYPNPFNPSTLIEYTLPEDGQTSLRVYNLLGREVAALVDEYQAAGIHMAAFEAGKQLPAGVYIYVLTTPAGQVNGRMLLTK